MVKDPKAWAGLASNTPTAIDRYLAHILAYCFALHFFFGLVVVLNASNLSYFYYLPATVQIVIAGPYVDKYLWMGSLIVLSTILLVKFRRVSDASTIRLIVAAGAIVLALLLFLAPVFGFPTTPLTYLLFAAGTLEFLLLLQDGKVSFLNRSSRSTPTRALVYLLVLFCTLEISAAVYYVLRPFNLAGGAVTGQSYALIELQLAYAAYGLLPWLYVSFLTSWLWIPAVNKLWNRSSEPLQPPRTKSEPGETQTVGLLSSIILDPKFVLVIALAAFIGYYPYFQNRGWLVGTDSYWRYYDPLVRMNAGGPIAAMRQALVERHPVPLMLLYGAQLATGMGPFETVKLSPLFLTLILAFAFLFFLGKKGAHSLGLMAALFSILSATTALGLYSSIIANWMVLAVWVVFLAYLGFRTDEHYRTRDFLVLLLLSTLMILIHPWTWGVFAAVISVASILALFQERRNGSRAGVSLILIVVIDVVFGLLSITYLAGSEGWRVVDALSLYTYVFRNPSTIFEFWPALNWTTKFWSPFFNPVYIFLAILGVFAVLRTHVSSWRRRLILSWICVSMVGSILVAPIGFVPNSPASSDSQLWRILFLTPFQVTAPFGVLWLSGKVYRCGSSVETGALTGYTWSPSAWVITVLAGGILMAFAPHALGLALLLILVPLITAFSIEKTAGCEGVLLSYAIQAVCVLIAFNYTARAISQLLINPHNYLPPNAQFGSG